MRYCTRDRCYSTLPPLDQFPRLRSRLQYKWASPAHCTLHFAFGSTPCPTAPSSSHRGQLSSTTGESSALARPPPSSPGRSSARIGAGPHALGDLSGTLLKGRTRPRVPYVAVLNRIELNLNTGPFTMRLTCDSVSTWADAVCDMLWSCCSCFALGFAGPCKPPKILKCRRMLRR